MSPILVLLASGGALLAAVTFAPPALAGSETHPPRGAERVAVSHTLADVPPTGAPQWGRTGPPTPTAVASGPAAMPPTSTPAPQVVLPDARGPLPPAASLSGQIPVTGAAGALTSVPRPTVASGVPGSPAAVPTVTSVIGTAGGASPSPVVPAGGSSGMARPVPELPATPNGARIVNLAQSLVGTRYTWGGTSTATGFDCSGLVHYVYRSLGYTIGRTVEEQFTSGRHVRLEEIRPGDILFYQNTYVRGLSHDGIYLGGGKFVHAVDESSGVAITRLTSAYREQRYAGAVRIVD